MHPTQARVSVRARCTSTGDGNKVFYYSPLPDCCRVCGQNTWTRGLTKPPISLRVSGTNIWSHRQVCPYCSQTVHQELSYLSPWSATGPLLTGCPASQFQHGSRASPVARIASSRRELDKGARHQPAPRCVRCHGKAQDRRCAWPLGRDRDNCRYTWSGSTGRNLRPHLSGLGWTRPRACRFVSGRTATHR